MYPNLSIVEIRRIYEQLKLRAKRNLNRNRLGTAIKFIEVASRWAYSFNWIFADGELDNMLVKIGEIWIGKKEINSIKNRVVFLDTIAMDNRGLTQQYLLALEHIGCEILFISIKPLKEKQREIRFNLKQYPKATTLFLDGKISTKEKIARIVEAIIEFRPEKALCHLMPWDCISLIVMSVCKDIIKYNINLTDHAFWLGSSIIDYNFEFRPYGRTLSLEKRGLCESKIINLPYYPILSENKEYEGFPDMPSDTIKILTGGAYYKMFGDNDKFFYMCDRLIDISSRVKIIIAGSGNADLMRKKISEMRNSLSVFLIGDRHDINEVFRHSDIFLNTYPIGGGLMTQYAAANGKPILSLGVKEEIDTYIVEEMVNQKGVGTRTFFSVEELLRYAERCINDQDFRYKEGLKNKSVIMDADDFNRLLEYAIRENKNEMIWMKHKVDYQSIIRKYLSLERESHHALEVLLALRVDAVFTFPQFTPTLINLLLKKTYIKLKRLLFC